MAKTTSKDKTTAGGADAGGWTDSISDALKDASKRASDLAQNPYARSLLAAGLVAAAAALASNKNVRDVTRRNLRAATEAVEVGADNAGKIGVAIVNAATEAVQNLLSLTGAASSAAQAAKSSAEKPKSAAKGKAPAKSRAAPKSSATKSSAKSAAAKSSGSPKVSAPKPATSRARTTATKTTAKRTPRAKPAAKPKS